MESFEVEKYYEWTTSQRKGKVEIYLAEDETQVYFKSGRFIQKDLFESSLSEISESEYHQKEALNAAPPVPMAPQSIEEWEAKLGNPQLNSIAPPPPKYVEEQSPIAIILNKQKKMVKETVQVEYELNMPNQKAIEFMTMMFDEDEVIEEISKYMISQISQEDFKNKIKESIKNRIESIVSDSQDG